MLGGKQSWVYNQKYPNSQVDARAAVASRAARAPPRAPPAAGRRAAAAAAAAARRQAAPARAAAVEAPAAAAASAFEAALAAAAAELPPPGDARARLAALAALGRALPPLAEADRTAATRVPGCTARAWLAATLGADGRLTFSADSDSEITRGLAAVLVRALSGLTPDEVLAADAAAVAGALGLGAAEATRSRAHGVATMLEAAKKRAAAARGDAPPRFPSLTISAAGVAAQGAFAAAQAAYLSPDPAAVGALAAALEAKRVGVVAHFYMDPQVQGVLAAAGERWPHVRVSDSLVMADAAVGMAAAGCRAIAVLGVDFMSENVRAILDEAGHAGVAVYRMAAADIGCSLAEAAEAPAYEAWLARGAATPRSLHVVYINTSLRTKARAHAAVPTVTCTSSNVVQTVLAAFAQVPGAHVWYGPDAYMGANLRELLAALAAAPPEEVAALHPAHTPASVAAALPRLHHYADGACVVHDLFGADVVDRVRRGYGDAYLTAHFEVPGGMFALAMEAARARGAGVVGSTQNILDFIAARLAEALARPFAERLTFVLGTESGMVTAIARRVRAMLAEARRDDVEVEIVFPVAADAVTTAATAAGGAAALPEGLALVPGPAAGEGCSLEGGCASCPYMKMNSLDALMRVLARVGDPAGEAALAPYRPRAYAERVGGRSVAAAGCVPILHMRAFQKGGRLPDELVEDVMGRHAAGAAGAAAAAAT